MLEPTATDFDAQSASAEEILSGIQTDWASQDPPPQFDPHLVEWQPPLYCAANLLSSEQGHRDERAQTIASLLRHGAELYQEFPQGIYRAPRWLYRRSPFPGQDPFRSPEPEYPDDFDFSASVPPDYSEEEELEEELPQQYGSRHVLHAILEDGSYFKPFLDYPGFLKSLDVEHRDPQGRTLLLSACRNALGADARADASLCDGTWDPNIAGVHRDPYPASDSPKDNAPMSDSHTLVKILLQLGADPLAVDNGGKNALHNLLVEECHLLSLSSSRPPVVRSTLRSFALNHPSLVNQADRYGTYPLHAALRRMRLHPERSFYVNNAQLEECVRELLSAGADPRATDGKGNTALHYLADEDLTGIWHGQETRRLFYDLLDTHGCAQDLNLRNHNGKTVAQLILNDNGCMESDKDEWYGVSRHQSGVDLRNWRDIDEEVFGKLREMKVVDWKDKTMDGDTLLHLVARSKLDQYRLIWRCEFLLGEGIDLKATDGQGRTARAVAIEEGNHQLAHALSSLEK